MSESWYLIPSKPTYLSGYEKENFDNYASAGLQEILDEDSPISSGVQIINADLTAISEIRAIVQNNTVDGIDKSDERQIIVNIGTLKCGDYIKFENTIWMVSSFVGNNKFYEKGIMIYCNYTIKFQSTTGTILSYPCITSGKTYSDDESNIMTLPSNRRSILLPFDEYTVRLRNSENRTCRFYVDKSDSPTPYKIIGDPDTTTYNYGSKGLIYIIVEQDEKNTTVDRPDLGICDYFTPTVIPDPVDPEVPTEIVAITSDATDNNVILGITHTFNATFKNELGVDVSGVVAVYSVDNTYGGKVILVDNHNGTCTVTVGSFDDTQLCTEQFSLTCTDTQHGFSSTVLLTIVGLF